MQQLGNSQARNSQPFGEFGLGHFQGRQNPREESRRVGFRLGRGSSLVVILQINIDSVSPSKANMIRQFPDTLTAYRLGIEAVRP